LTLLLLPALYEWFVGKRPNQGKKELFEPLDADTDSDSDTDSESSGETHSGVHSEARSSTPSDANS